MVLLPGSGGSSSTWCGQGVGWVVCGYSLGVGWVLCVCVCGHTALGLWRRGWQWRDREQLQGLPPSSGAGTTAEEAEPLGWKVVSQVDRKREKARTCELLAWLRN